MAWGNRARLDVWVIESELTMLYRADVLSMSHTTTNSNSNISAAST